MSLIHFGDVNISDRVTTSSFMFLGVEFLVIISAMFVSIRVLSDRSNLENII